MSASKIFNQLATMVACAFLIGGSLVAPTHANEQIPSGVDNPPATKQCGFDLVLLLDASTSIRDFGGASDVNGAVDDVVTASTSLLQAFAGTNSRVAIVSYNNLAQVQIGFTDVTSTSIAAGGVHNQALGTPWSSVPGTIATPTQGYTEHVRVPDLSTNINPLTGFGTDTGFTNWQAGFDATLGVLQTARAGVPTLVMHMTDGRPTAYTTVLGDGSISYGLYGKQPPSLGITAANLVKAFDSGTGTGTHLYSIGVRGAESGPVSILDTYLGEVSGPNVFDETAGDQVSDFDAINDDVIVLSDFQKLESIFGRFAASLCAPSVTLTKVTNSADAVDSFTPAAGWEFGAEVSTAATSVYDWVLPDDTVTGASATATSSASGRVQFQWDVTDEPNWDGAIRLSEQAQASHDLSDIVCTRTQLGDENTTSAVEFRPSIDDQNFDISVGVTDIISCEVKNEIDRTPALALQKTATPTMYDEIGDVIVYDYIVTSIGVDPVYFPITIEDDRIDDDSSIICDEPAGVDFLATSEFVLCSVSYEISAADLALDEIKNTATASGKDKNGTPVKSEPDTATITVDEVISIGLTKEANPKTYNSVGQLIEYTYTVTNTGNRPLSSVDQVMVTDNRIDTADINCPSSLGLASGQSIQCLAYYEITDADMTDMSVTNIATASVSGIMTPPVDEEVKLIAIQLIKTVDPDSYDAAGQNLTYTFEVTNTGTADIVGPVLIFDARLSLNGYVCREASSATIPVMAPGQSVQCDYGYTTVDADVAAGEVANVATATADGAESEDRVSVPYTGEPVDPGTCDTTGDEKDDDKGGSKKSGTDGSKDSSKKPAAKPSVKSSSKNDVCVDSDGNLRVIYPASSQAGSVPTRKASFYKQNPRGLFQCLAHSDGGLDVGIMTIRDENFDDELDASRYRGNVGDTDATAETAYEMLYGLMSAKASKFSDGKRRSKMDGICLKAAKQLAAARCNHLLFGAYPNFNLEIASLSIGKFCSADSGSTVSRRGRTKQVNKWVKRLKRFNKSGRIVAIPEDVLVDGQTGIVADDPTDPSD